MEIFANTGSNNWRTLSFAPGARVTVMQRSAMLPLKSASVSRVGMVMIVAIIILPSMIMTVVIILLSTVLFKILVWKEGPAIAAGGDGDWPAAPP
jgi:hypothetical protein